MEIAETVFLTLCAAALGFMIFVLYHFSLELRGGPRRLRPSAHHEGVSASTADLSWNLSGEEEIVITDRFFDEDRKGGGRPLGSATPHGTRRPAYPVKTLRPQRFER